MEIRNINVPMTSNAVYAVDSLCPQLKYITLQTGSNVSYLSLTPYPCLSLPTTYTKPLLTTS